MTEEFKTNLELYDKAVQTLEHIQRKGKTSPYTSHNGHMFSFLRKDAVLGIRLSEEERDLFEQKYGNKEFKSHGAVMRNYVTISQELLENTKELASYIQKGFEYVSTLKPK